MSANTFTNPADSSTYAWPRNHGVDGEQEFGMERSIERTATTDGIGVVRQQGADEPLTLELAGFITAQAQHDAFVDWAQLCRTQTIYFTDFDGNQYEVIITAFRSRRAPTGASFLWQYTLSMDVISVISGDWA
jgi:hypothetical protein